MLPIVAVGALALGGLMIARAVASEEEGGGGKKSGKRVANPDAQVAQSPNSYLVTPLGGSAVVAKDKDGNAVSVADLVGKIVV